MNEQIKKQLYNTLALLGAKSDLLGTIECWGNELPDAEVLAGIKAWNEEKEKELRERLLLSSTNNA